MSAQIINGKEVANEIREKLKKEVEELKNKGITPGLATILVGNNPASQVYVNMKQKACKNIGIYSEQHTLEENTSQEELIDLIEKLNSNEKIHGILCQLPLPSHIDTNKILFAISPEKDVDGFHPVNIGRLSSKKSLKEIEEEKLFIPCTPYGIIQLLRKYNIEIQGKEAVVVGRSNIVGKPISMLLLASNATVTVCHSRTKNLPEVTSRADILIAAIGRSKMITKDMIKENAVVIDVGVNRLPEGLVGDVDFENVKEKALFITPVPGGVGPMTITMLLYNTVLSAKKFLNS